MPAEGSDKSHQLLRKETEMDKWSFGLTMTVIGTVGTFLTLGVVIVVTKILKRLYPVASKSESENA